MGDGYTAGEQGDFDDDAQARLDELLTLEPYASYKGLMNFWLVHAVSADSGISRDAVTNPGNVQDKDTALGSYFWCDGIERLLCVDKPSVDAYAQRAPAVDLVMVIANSPRYGGAGYNFGPGGDASGDAPEYAGISTLSSGHEQSYLIAAHEIGHSLGNLADEYYYCDEASYKDYCAYEGLNNGEAADVPELNVTAYGPGAGYGEDYLIANEYKWYRWLGTKDPSGGTVGMYDGGRYYASGIYRPTQDSIMKSLTNVNFNLPGTEGMIAGFYRYGAAATSNIPDGASVSRSDRLTVDLADLGRLAKPRVRWFVDGTEVRRVRNATTVIPQRLGVSASRKHTVSVVIDDTTKSIRDPQIRKATRTVLSWHVFKPKRGRS